MNVKKRLGAGFERLETRAAPSTLLGMGVSIDPAWLPLELVDQTQARPVRATRVEAGFVATAAGLPGINPAGKSLTALPASLESGLVAAAARLTGSNSAGKSLTDWPAKLEDAVDSFFTGGLSSAKGLSDTIPEHAGGRSISDNTVEDFNSSKGESFGAPMGRGSVTVNAVPNATGTFSADIEVKLKGAAPNTTYTLQRAPEVGRPLAADGICQRADGLWPWEQPNSEGFPPAPAFLTFVNPATGVPVTISTNGGGNGKVSFHFDAPGIASGATFDVEFRAIDLAGVASPIHSDCFQVTPQ
jgi:hypothetical protein